MNESEGTYGVWEQELDLVPAISRSRRPARWVLLGQQRHQLPLQEEGDTGTGSATLSLTVDGSKFVR